jgi:toxin ParE1/3/4
MRLRYTQTALLELDEILAYLSQRHRPAAVLLSNRIERLGSVIAEMPLVGHRTSEEGVRMMPVVRYPFALFYAVDQSSDEVVVLHVRHTARKQWEGSDSFR